MRLMVFVLSMKLGVMVRRMGFSLLLTAHYSPWTRLMLFLAHKYLPTLENFLTTPDGQPGWVCDFYNHDDAGEPTGEPVGTFVLQDTRVKLNDFLPPGLTPTWTIKLHGALQVEKTAEYELGLTVAGRAKLWVDEKMTIDNWTKQRPGEFFYGYVHVLFFWIVSFRLAELEVWQTRNCGGESYSEVGCGQACQDSSGIHQYETTSGP